MKLPRGYRLEGDSYNAHWEALEPTLHMLADLPEALQRRILSVPLDDALQSGPILALDRLPPSCPSLVPLAIAMHNERVQRRIDGLDILSRDLGQRVVAETPEWCWRSVLAECAGVRILVATVDDDMSLIDKTTRLPGLELASVTMNKARPRDLVSLPKGIQALAIDRPLKGETAFQSLHLPKTLRMLTFDALTPGVELSLSSLKLPEQLVYLRITLRRITRSHCTLPKALTRLRLSGDDQMSAPLDMRDWILPHGLKVLRIEDCDLSKAQGLSGVQLPSTLTQIFLMNVELGSEPVSKVVWPPSLRELRLTQIVSRKVPTPRALPEGLKELDMSWNYVNVAALSAALPSSLERVYLEGIQAWDTDFLDKTTAYYLPLNGMMPGSTTAKSDICDIRLPGSVRLLQLRSIDFAARRLDRFKLPRGLKCLNLQGTSYGNVNGLAALTLPQGLTLLMLHEAELGHRKLQGVNLPHSLERLWLPCLPASTRSRKQPAASTSGSAALGLVQWPSSLRMLVVESPDSRVLQAVCGELCQAATGLQQLVLLHTSVKAQAVKRWLGDGNRTQVVVHCGAEVRTLWYGMFMGASVDSLDPQKLKGTTLPDVCN